MSLTAEEFIKKGIDRFGDKFSYEKTNFKKLKQKIIITCNVHGDICVLPYDFLKSKYGCKKCADAENGINKRNNIEWFLHRAKEKHGDKYDYSKVEYKGRNKKVCIICPEHGEFWQTPDSHINGGNCPKCNIKKKLTTEEFIEKAKKVHGDKYDYSKVEYTNNKTKVCIICPEHGEFWQTPNQHLLGHDCQLCRNTKASETRIKHSKEIFVKKAKEKHGDKYDYSLAQYEGCYKKIQIICKKHGIFEQSPNCHLSGNGCPKCRRSKMEERLSSELIKNNISFEFQKRFEWLGKQSCDFYIPSKNIIIECQGNQHYEGWSYRKDIFKKIYELDKKKNELCKKNNVNIIYWCESDTIFNAGSIYNKENTFLTIDEILKIINK